MATEIYSVLPKPIYLKTSSGMRLIAEEGVTLPAKCVIQVRRVHSDPAVTVEVYQADERVGEIRVDNIPEDAGEGCPVEIDVEITAKNELRGVAKVLTRQGAVAQTCPVRICFPPIKVADLSELRGKFEALEAQREQLELRSLDPEQRVRLGGPDGKLVRKLTKLFAEQSPDRYEIQRALRDLSRLVTAANPQLELLPTDREQLLLLSQQAQRLVTRLERLFGDVSPERQEIQLAVRELDGILRAEEEIVGASLVDMDDMEPPRSSFRGLFETCSQELSTGATNPQLQAFRPMLSKIESQANDAFTTKNHKKWAQANENLAQLCRRIKKNSTNDGGDVRCSQELPPTPLLKDLFRSYVDQFRGVLQDLQRELKERPNYENRLKSRIDGIGNGLDELQAEIDGVGDDADGRQALARLQVAMRRRQKLQKDLETVDVDAI